MNESKGRIGPGASTILMILIVMMMTMLGVLALMSARSDLRMADRAEQFTQAYYDAQTESGLWISELDQELLSLREKAAGNADVYAELVQDALSSGIEEEVEFSTPAGDARMLYVTVKILPISEKDRILVMDKYLESSHTVDFEEENGWTLIS